MSSCIMWALGFLKKNSNVEKQNTHPMFRLPEQPLKPPRVLQRESFQSSGFESHVLGLGTCAHQGWPDTSLCGDLTLCKLEVNSP